MKGFIIFEDFKKLINCKEILDGNYNCVISDYPEGTFSGVINRVTGATCNKDDTYDFETGALIALMKMCGREKALKAVEELYNLKEPRGADLDGDILESKAEYMAKENKRYIKRIKELEEENETLKKEKEQIIIARSILYNKLEEENNYLKYIKSCRESAIESLEKTRDLLINKNNELIEENEKLQHGYLDTDMIFCGGRQNGKQYKALVETFKKIPQNKVDEAYKEAYNTKLPVWQREFLKEALSIYKPPTKREQMWNDILACGDCEHSEYVEVKKEDLETFAKECNEKKIFNVIGDEFRSGECWFDDDSCIFQIFRKSAGFVCAERVYLAPGDVVIDYLPPMRWDLFKKGRRIIRVTPDKLDEFMTKCSKELGGIMRPNLKRYKEFPPTFVMISDYHYDNKPTIHIMTPEDLVRNQHENSKKYSDKKIVDWEDVR